MTRTTIQSVTVEPLNIPLHEPFTIATGSMSEARNVLITITLTDGSIGYGECSPFSPSTGESQATALAAAQEAAQLLIGRDIDEWRTLAKLVRSTYYAQATVCAGIEIALVDAFTRSYGMPFYVFFGNAGSSIETDMSIPIVEPEHAAELALATQKQGITRIKIKVGGKMEDDIARVVAIHQATPEIGLTLDANQGYTANEALLCLDLLEKHGIRPLLMEQPVLKGDYEGLRYVTQHTTVPVAADESAGSLAEVAHLIAMQAASVINIKLMKCGLVEAMDIAALCRATNTQLMIGAMLESRLGNSASAHFAAGVGGFSYVDLDTPMLLSEDPFTGGYEQKAGIYDLSKVERGLGVTPNRI
jgi:L-alanine-DL-glutamate epimerase-like enolase superfamily enzyme